MGKSKPARPKKAHAAGKAGGSGGVSTTVLAAAAVAAAAGAATLLLSLGGGPAGGTNGPNGPSVTVRAIENGAAIGAGEPADPRPQLFDHNLTASDFVGEDERRYEELTEGMEVVLVPREPGKHFIWPGYDIGHKFEVPDIKHPVPENPIQLEMMSHSPKVFHVHNFLSEKEANFLVKKAQSKENPYSIRPSTTGHKSWTQGGEGSVATTRTSHNGFDVDSPTAMSVKKRAFDLLRIPYLETMADGIQILRYKPKQAYIGHHDYFPTAQSGDFNWDPQAGGSNRFATVLLYLSDVSEGGGTVFTLKPNASATELHGEKSLQELVGGSDAAKLFDKASQPWEGELVKKCFTNFRLLPKKGDAILFYSQKADGELDLYSEHAGCPVLNGTKWAANVWVWNAPRYGM